MTYAEAIQFLYGLQIFGANLGLERTRRLAAFAGNPQEKLRFIHIAGTNGKGSTCAMLESIYRAAGLRVGLFTSPHLVSFRERIQVNRTLISQSDVARLVAEFKRGAGDLSAESNRHDGVTFFEFVTAMALKYFAEQECDVVMWETGLGGRLDATNIVTPLVSVITNIALDHTQWLGDTLEKIAAEKAGIIKSRVPVITGEANPEALRVIENVARLNESPLTKVTKASSLAATIETAGPILPGEHQRRNAALALATVKVLQRDFPINPGQIRAGLAAVSWPGRLQLIIQPGGRKLLLDGAHNLAGAETLRAAILDGGLDMKPPVALVLGVLNDKPWSDICETLAPLAARIVLVPVSSQRTVEPERLAEVCRIANPSAEVVVCRALSGALERTAKDPYVVITGSLYLVGEALALVDPDFAGLEDESRLNEWAATPASVKTAR